MAALGKKTYKSLAKLIGLGLLLYMLSILNYHKLLIGIRDSRPVFILIAFLFLIPVYVIKAFRWRFMLSLQGVHYPYRDSFLAFWASNFIAFITPGRFGEVAKAFYLMKDKNLPFSTSLPTVIFDRLFDMYTLFFFSVMGMLVFSASTNNWQHWAVIVPLLLLPLLVFWEKAITWFARRIFSLPLLKSYRVRFNNGLKSFYCEMSSLLTFRSLFGLILSMAAYILLFFCSWWISKASASDLSFMRVGYFMAMVAILSFLPITVAGFGTREAALVVLFGQIGKSPEEAILFSTLYFLVFFVLGGVMGYFCFLLKPLEFRALKSFVRDQKGHEAASLKTN